MVSTTTQWLHLWRFERPHVLGQGELLRDFVFGIVIPMCYEDRNLGSVQASHFPREKKAGVVVLPVSIIEVARDDHEVDLVFDRDVD